MAQSPIKQDIVVSARKDQGCPARAVRNSPALLSIKLLINDSSWTCNAQSEFAACHAACDDMHDAMVGLAATSVETLGTKHSLTGETTTAGLGHGSDKQH